MVASLGGIGAAAGLTACPGPGTPPPGEPITLDKHAGDILAQTGPPRGTDTIHQNAEGPFCV